MCGGGGEAPRKALPIAPMIHTTMATAKMGAVIGAPHAAADQRMRVRIHQTLEVTPAMAAGLTKELRDMDWLVSLVEARDSKPGPRGPDKTEGRKTRSDDGTPRGPRGPLPDEEEVITSIPAPEASILRRTGGQERPRRWTTPGSRCCLIGARGSLMRSRPT